MKSEIRNLKYSRAGRPCHLAFTLVEVLVVITILALLVGILAPSINKAMQLARAAETQAYMQQLQAGALQYQKDTGYFPGQEYSGIIGTGDNFTGSQILAACVFGLALDTTGHDVEYLTGFSAPTSPYVDFKSERVLSGAPSNDPISFAPCDTFSDKRAILYYPSRIGNNGTIGAAFAFGDNSDHMNTTTYPNEIEANFKSTIADMRFNPSATGDARQAYKSDSFLLIGAGLDRAYFTTDDLRNF
jgi:prepilin-type N-terminal cleavage/methylation domain-containing protein